MHCVYGNTCLVAAGFAGLILLAAVGITIMFTVKPPPSSVSSKMPLSPDASVQFVCLCSQLSIAYLSQETNGLSRRLRQGVANALKLDLARVKILGYADASSRRTKRDRDAVETTQEERGMAARVSFRIVALLGRENDIPLLAVAVEKAFSLRLVDKKLAQLGLQDVSVRLLGGVEAVLPGFIKEQNVADNKDVCGNGVTNAGEWCDDGNELPLDGCYECSIEEGWTCESVIAGNASKCYELCGDLIVVGSEECEDGNFDNGDGCDETCAIEPKFG